MRTEKSKKARFDSSRPSFISQTQIKIKKGKKKSTSPSSKSPVVVTSRKPVKKQSFGATIKELTTAKFTFQEKTIFATDKSEHNGDRSKTSGNIQLNNLEFNANLLSIDQLPGINVGHSHSRDDKVGNRYGHGQKRSSDTHRSLNRGSSKRKLPSIHAKRSSVAYQPSLASFAGQSDT